MSGVVANEKSSLDPEASDYHLGMIKINKLASSSWLRLRNVTSHTWARINGSYYVEDFVRVQPLGVDNRALMRSGRAPFVSETQRWAGRTRYELHHMTPIKRGGVYTIQVILWSLLPDFMMRFSVVIFIMA